jgi:hypothetical protein
LRVGFSSDGIGAIAAFGQLQSAQDFHDVVVLFGNEAVGEGLLTLTD